VVAPPAVPVSSTPAPALAAQVICRPKNTKKGPFDFEQLKLVQEMNNEHTGAIWVIKFRLAFFIQNYCSHLEIRNLN
jgi:hypothetical protein